MIPNKYNRFIDLTHTLTSESPGWDTSCNFKHIITSDYADFATPVKFRIGSYTMPAGIGTHIDAPSHCCEGALTIDKLALEQLIVPCVCIDVSNMADQNFILTRKNILTFEDQYGEINSGNLVIVYTGWDRYWNDADAYRNNYQFPSVSLEAAEYLVDKDIAGLGVDTLSPDCLKSGFPVHKIILGGGKYIIENVANARQLPARGALALAFPLKVQNGTEAPLRLIAMCSLKNGSELA